MRILVSNDDGIYSPGIATLATVASRFGIVRIVAPDVEQSSMGHAITSNRPLRYKRTPVKDFEAYRVNGTPADCVALGLHFWGGADLVLSGVNLGSNLGSATWHSGTLAAAKQAVLLGARGIAVSTPADDEEPEFERLQPHVEEDLGLVINESSPQLLNINIPADSKGILWTRQSVRRYDGKMVRDTDPMGREHFWFTVVPVEQVEEGNDRWAVATAHNPCKPLPLVLTDCCKLK